MTLGKREITVNVTDPANSCQESRTVKISVADAPYDPPPPATGSAAYYLMKAAERRAQG